MLSVYGQMSNGAGRNAHIWKGLLRVGVLLASPSESGPAKYGAGQAPRYVVVGLASMCALGISLLVGGPGIPGVAPELFLGAVAVSAWYGGLRPALLATGLGFLALDYFFETPLYSLEVDDPGTLLNSLAYLLIAVLLGSLNAQLHAAQVRAEVARRDAEAALLARDEALQAVSHDLRTPLTAIRAAVAALCEADGAAPQLIRTRLLANVAAESQRLEHFIGDALALARIEAGVSPKRTICAPGEVVSAMLDRHTPLLGGRPIHFDIPDSLPLLELDVGLLAQALSSLLHNVAVHTPPESAVWITGELDAAGGFRLAVADAGPGIAVADRELVFRKFERLHAGGGGAGLGLTLARAATKAQGGRLWVETSPAGGACFVLCLPGPTI